MKVVRCIVILELLTIEDCKGEKYEVQKFAPLC